jgi:hypothetical protein
MHVIVSAMLSNEGNKKISQVIFKWLQQCQDQLQIPHDGQTTESFKKTIMKEIS